MKKKQYIQPKTNVVDIHMDALMLTASNSLGGAQQAKTYYYYEEEPEPDTSLLNYSVWDN